MTKLATIIAAAALALTVTAADAKPTGPRLVIVPGDAALVWDDGKIVQTEYIPQYLLDQAGILDCIHFEDGSLSCN